MTKKPRTGTYLALAAALTLALAPALADARPGRSGSLGSRGDRTYEAPPATSTAPRTAAPMERSATPAPGVQRPSAPLASPAGRQGMFGRGGFMGGLLGAGLFGLLLGYGFSGGLGGFASILGLLIQVALVFFLVRLAFRWFQRRQQPAMAGAGHGGPVPGAMPGADLFRRDAHQAQARPAGMGAAGAGAGAAGGYAGARRPAERRDDVGVSPADYQAFERVLVGVQDAYSREDVGSLRMIATPEMTGYFAEEIEQHARRGVVNRISDVSLLQGDLAEAWRERGAEYATVALRFSLKDWTEDRATGRVVEGDPARAEEATEVWTFRRVPGGPWLLSAIQQS